MSDSEKVVWNVGGETLDLKLPKDIQKSLTDKPKDDEKLHTFFGC